MEEGASAAKAVLQRLHCLAEAKLINPQFTHFVFIVGSSNSRAKSRRDVFWCKPQSLATAAKYCSVNLRLLNIFVAVRAGYP
ncbi:MAG: hypothetical protein HY231_11685 [Acidobacteria bacterium]|nr:hypothetical protein [Acidobacteriota bacterium]